MLPSCEIKKMRKVENDHTTLIHSKINKDLKCFKEFITTNNLTVTMGDKNAGVVVLNTRDYITKTEDFFKENNIVNIKTNPTKTYSTKLNTIINQYETTLSKINIKPYNVKVMNPQTPQLHSLIKLHKENKTIRPIVGNRCTPASKIAKSLQTFIQHTLQFLSKYAIKTQQNSFKN